MADPVERETQIPCGWCGKVVAQPGGNRRRRRYCDRSCQQRAYEIRTAGKRLQRDQAAGLVLPEPETRIVERVLQSRSPHTTAGWVQVLGELDARVRDKRVPSWDWPRLRPAVARLSQALGAQASPAVPAAVLEVVVARLAATSAGRGESTTLARLSGELAADVAQTRALLGWLAEHRAVRCQRAMPTGALEPVDPCTIAEHARFTITR